MRRRVALAGRSLKSSVKKHSSLIRRLRIEALEQRLVLSSTGWAGLAGLGDSSPIHPFPTGLDSQSLAVRDAIASVTTTASSERTFDINRPQFKLLENLPGVHPNLVQSSDLINLLDFRQDPRFAGIDGRGYSTVILDTGIDLNHPFFGPDADFNGVADRIVFNADFITGGPNADDVAGHGTHVSSIIASQDPTFTGMAPGANIIHLQVLDDFGSGTAAALESALQWVVANTATYNIVSVNMSLGFTSNFSSPTTFPEVGISDELAAIAAQNVIVASAAGNDYFAFQSPGVSYPAADPNSLAVGAVWDADVGGGVGWSSGAIDFSTGPDRIVSFSQRHPVETTVFAPGAFITAAVPGGGVAEYAGTSQATPHIAGIAALMQQLAVRETGQRLTMSQFAHLVRVTGMPIVDGDDENDNVPNTFQQYHRVDVLALANAVISGGQSDLTIPEPLTVSSPTASPGGLMSVDFTVANQGASPTGNYRSSLYLSTDSTIDASDLLLTSFTNTLNPGDSTNYQHFAAALPAGLALGTYYLGVRIDDQQVVTESVEANNVSAITVFVVAATPELRAIDLETGREIIDGVSQIDFGTLEFEAPPVSRTLRIYNDGPVALALNSAVLPPQFSAILPTVVPALGSVDVTVSMLSDVPGGLGGSVEIASNDSDENPFQFNVSGFVNNPDDHGDDAATATPIDVPATVSGEILPSYDLDWFSFQAYSGSTYQFQTFLGSLGDSILYLYDSDGVTLLAANDDYFDLSSFISWIAPSDATYYIAVGGYGSSAGSYGLQVTLSDDHGNDAFAATPTVDPNTINGNIEIPNDVDWFTWNAVAGVTYRLETQLGTLADTVLRVFDIDGTTQLAVNDDNGSSNASLIEWVAPKDGNYFVEVRAFSQFQRGNYSLSITGDDDFGDSAANATLITAPGSIQGEIEIPFDTDWFRFSAVAGAHYQISTTLGTLSDSVLRVIDTNGGEWARDDDSGPGLASFIEWIAPYTGDFFLEVAGLNWRSGSYELSIAVLDDHGNNGSTATSTSDPTTEFGVLEQYGDVDWFSFTAYAGAAYRFETSLGALGDSLLSLYGTDKHTLLALNDDGGFGLASLIEWVAPATGIYFVQVSGFSFFDLGDYSLSIIGDDDFGDNARNAAFAIVPSDIPGRIEHPGDVDWFNVNLAAGLNYRFEVLLDSLSNSVVRLYASDGVTLLATDDDGGALLGSLIEWNALESGSYYVEVSGFNTSVGAYSLELSIVDDHGNSSDDATPLAIPNLADGQIEYPWDTDWFSFQATGGQAYRFETILHTLGDSVFSVYDTDGVTPLAYDDDSGPGLASLINWVAPQDGTYFIAVSSYGQSYTGAYQLQATALGGLLGDFNYDGYVGFDDYATWKATFGSLVATPGRAADANADGIVDAADYTLWRAHLGESLPGGSSSPWASTVDPKTFATSDGASAPPPAYLRRAYVEKSGAASLAPLAVAADASAASAAVRDSGFAALSAERFTLPAFVPFTSTRRADPSSAAVAATTPVARSSPELLLANRYRGFRASSKPAASSAVASAAAKTDVGGVSDAYTAFESLADAAFAEFAG